MFVLIIYIILIWEFASIRGTYDQQQMSYNRQRNRQQIITKLIQQAQNQKLQCVQSGLNDPFQIYYYPTPLQDPQQIQKLQKRIKQKLIQQANMNKMIDVQQEMNRQLYLINEQIKAEQVEQQYLDLMIKQLEGQVRAAQIRKQANKQKCKAQSNSTGCQTISVKQKQMGTDYQLLNIEPRVGKQKTNILKQLSTTPVYSINVYSQGLHQKQINQQKSKENDKTIKQEQNSKTIKIQSKQITNNPKQAGALNIKQLNSDLQKEMKYLQHLKNSNRRREYKDQKRKVKFLMQLFWKHAQGVQKCEQSDMSLPFIQI